MSERGRERSSVYFFTLLDGLYSQDWARPKPGVRTFFLVSHVGVGTQALGHLPLVSQVHEHFRSGAAGTRTDTHRGSGIVDSGLTSYATAPTSMYSTSTVAIFRFVVKIITVILCPHFSYLKRLLLVPGVVA